MADDLTEDDLEEYTSGRLSADDPVTHRELVAALAKVRHFCGWHVSPVRTESISLRGSGRQYLVIPTLKVVALTTITEDGVSIDPSDVEMYSDEPGVLYKKSGHWRGRIEITMDHGFDAEEAADFYAAILQYADSNSLSIGTGGDGTPSMIRVDDITLEWQGAAAERILGAVRNNPMSESALYRYRLLPFA